MRRRLLMMVLVAMICFSGLWARSYFNSYSAAYNVNLADPNKEYVGTDSGEWGSTGYNDRTLVAQVGFADTSSPVSIEVTFDNASWMYQSASQPTLKRPFGLDVVVRQRWYRWNCTNGALHQTDETVQVHHYGLQEGGNSSQDATFSYSNPTNGSVEKDGNDLPGEHRNTICGWYSHKLIGAWVEIVLVLPKIDPYNTSYTVGSANDYYASFDITLSGGAEGSWHCVFTGWYENPQDGEVQFVLNVVPNANASSINLDSDDGIAYGSQGLPIGTYFYTTTKSNSSEDKDYYAFVSSSQSPTAPGGTFSLVRTGTDGGTGNEIPYEIGLDSLELGRDPKWFNGAVVMSDGAIDPAGTFYSSRADNMSDIDGNPVLQRWDEGDILFRLANGADVNTLAAGVYSSNVYFHVVTEE